MKKNRTSYIFTTLAIAISAYLLDFAVFYYPFPYTGFVGGAFSALDAWKVSLDDAHAREEEQAETEALEALDEPSAVSTQPYILHGKTTWDKARAYEGYTLLSYRFSTVVYLLDMNGDTVWKWDIPFEKIWPNPQHVTSGINAKIFVETAHVFPNGDLLAQYTAYGDSPYGYGIAKVDKHGNLIWKYTEHAHHDFYIDHEGDIYALTQDWLKKAPEGMETLNTPTLIDFIVKLSPDGKELDRISILDAFRNSEFAPMLWNADINFNQVEWDQFHTNSIRKLEPDIADKFPMFKAGQLLVSIRSLNALAVIDPDLRKVVWLHIGPWRWQHGARFLPNGNIAVLDNMGYYVNNKRYSKILEYDPKTLKTKWFYTTAPEKPMYTVAYGRLEPLPNGNLLAAIAFERKIIEITPDKKIAWSFKIVGRFKKDEIEYLNTARRYGKDTLPFLNQ